MIQIPIIIPSTDCGESMGPVKFIIMFAVIIFLAPFLVRLLLWWFDKVMDWTGGG